MAIAKISKEKVFKVASQLHKKDIKVTADNVRATLGAGSKTTILKYLNEWRDSGEYNPKLNAKQLDKKLVAQLKVSQKLTSEILHNAELLERERARNEEMAARILELEVRLEEKTKSLAELKEAFAKTEASLKSSFNETVVMLTEQVAKINERAVQKVQEVGHSYDEKIMEAKLEVRELQYRLTAVKDNRAKKE